MRCTVKDRKVYIFAIGNFPKNRNQMYQVIGYIKELDGMLGIHPCYPDGNLLVFDSINNCKRGKNLLEMVGIKTGDNIMNGSLSEDKQHLTVIDPAT